MDNMIHIENVSKMYKLGQIGGTTLRDEIQRKMAKRFHREDPTKKIGEKTTNGKETFLALNDVSFDVKQGERVGIIGHNGAGKSTLLKLISRITAPSAGTIGLNGRVASMLEVGTGFHAELTGRENIYMNGAILGMDRAEIDSKIEDIIEFSECRQFIDTPVKRYSSGMYVKLAFSVAAHLDSEIMIMDEVLAVGDMSFQKKCLDKMSLVSKTEGRTILYVSHNMNTIRQLCDRCIVLDHGQVVFDGDVEPAIDIYIGLKEASPKTVECREIKRTMETSNEITFTSISILEKDEWVQTVGDKLRIELSMKANKDLKDVGFRSRLTSGEDTSISVFLAPKLFSCKKGEQIIVPIELDTSQLVPGRYSLSPVLYGTNGLGGWEYYDHLDRSITFEIKNKVGFNENMEWNKRYWGYVKLPEVKDLRDSTN